MSRASGSLVSPSASRVRPKKCRLFHASMVFAKVTQTDTNQPIALLWAQVYLCAQFQRDIGQLFTRCWLRSRCLAPGENLELLGLQFEDHSARNSGFFA